jgi:ribose 5-phosphate isomerase B
MSIKIVVASDHGGYALKEKVKSWLTDAGHEVRDFGCFGTESVDYPDFALPAAQALARGEADRGVLICTTGIGVSICANKVRGVRCALCCDPMTARMTREHNDTNALAIGAGVVGENLAKEMVFTWLSTPFSGIARHQRRIDKISAYESKNNEC